MSLAPDTPPSPDQRARWPDRVRTLFAAWQATATEEERRQIVSELWLLVNAAVARYVRIHCQSYGHVDPEEVRDIAAEKTVSFLRGLENGRRPPAELQSSQVCSYISVLARNGLVDALRKSTRARAHEHLDGDTVGTPLAPESDGAEVNLRHREFLRAICQCVAALAPKARTAWFLRAFMDLPSKTIAAHPDVCMTPTAVDMMLSRARRSLRQCMESKGFSPDDAPPGTFVALWELLNDARSKGGNGDVPAPR